jgi:3-deoxy-D-manno-octulosonic-acid transferase
MNPLDAAYALAALLAAPIWARKARGDWKARFGHAPHLPAPAPQRPRVLLHAVSVGEVNALRALVPLLTAHAEVVVSVGTDTGIARARDLFEKPALAHVVRYPLDFSSSVNRFLDRVRPDAVALVELELWPNFIAACRRRGVPVAVINGRLSERSFRGYKRARPFLRRTFATLHTAAVQNDVYRDRFIAMGVPPERCIVTDTMKWDAAAIADTVAGSGDLARQLGIDRARPLVVAGSTAEDEESLLHDACPPGVQLLCAPRKPEHFDDAAAALPGCTRRSAHRDAAHTAPTNPAGRFLLDTIGELRAAYALADVVVLGRSFGSLFGSDPIEPVALGKPTLIGPAHADFLSTVQTLHAAGGLKVVTREQLPAALAELLTNPATRAALADRGRACIRAHQGATQRHADLLLSLVHPETPSHGGPDNNTQ